MQLAILVSASTSSKLANKLESITRVYYTL